MPIGMISFLGDSNRTLLRTELIGSPWNWARLQVQPGYFQLAIMAEFSGLLPNTITAVDDITLEDGYCIDLCKYWQTTLLENGDTVNDSKCVDIESHNEG